MMPFDLIQRKAGRAVEALDLLCFYAADMASRRQLFHIYASLSHPERYDDEVFLRFRIGGQVFPFHMRISDIFIVAEILHEQQYRLKHPHSRPQTIVDLGANIGASVIWFLGNFPEADIHVFEPARDNLHFLERNIAAWPRVRLETVAVGREAGTIDLFHGEFGGMHSIKDAADVDRNDSETVRIIRLADYLDDHGLETIDLLKIDIEGAEMDALAGCGERLRDIRHIVGEVHENVIDVDAFFEFLKQAGFSRIDRQGFKESRENAVHGFEASRAPV